MIVHFFTKGDEQVGDSRQRAFRIAEELNARGVTSVVHRPSVLEITKTRWPQKFSLLVTTIKTLLKTKKRDVIFLQRTIGNKYFFVIMVLYLKVFRRKMIFDFDDAIYMHDFYKTKILTRMADVVVVCSETLVTWAKQYNKNVHMIHTSLKFSAYALYTKEYAVTSESCVIGWIGTAKNHHENLRLLVPVFEKLLSKTGISFTFALVGAGGDREVRELFEGIEGLKTEFIDTLDWNNPESVPQEIQKFDIGVMPLVGTGEWNLARSSFKPLEYMACGVATVCSAVGEITHIIRDGENGLLAATEDEWVEKLDRLLSDRELQMVLGKAGQEYVWDNECYEAIVSRIAEFL